MILEKLKFVSVGLVNTAIDFFIFIILTKDGFHPLLSNYVSTTIALSFSFFANKKFTFKTGGSLKKQASLFIPVTLFGLWVLQPLTIFILQRALEFTSEASNQLILAKIGATSVSLVWNYLLYSRLVFKS